MEVFVGKTDGSIEVNKPWHLCGMVDGDMIAGEGAVITIDGMVTGDLVLKEGSEVVLNGMVNGETVVKGGSIKVFGHTSSVRIENEKARVFIDENAFVGN